MAKRKNAIEAPKAPKVPEVFEEPEAPKVPKAPEAGELGYTVGRWGWHDQYICKTCQFDTLDLDVMLEHLVLAHVSLPMREPAQLPKNGTPEMGAADEEKADGVYEIELKE